MARSNFYQHLAQHRRCQIYYRSLIPFKKPSEQFQHLNNAQRTDTFIKAFREAVRAGDVDAMYIQERFTLPKQHSLRGGDGRYQKDARDMLFEATPEFEQWFQHINKGLAPARQGGEVKVTAGNIEAGLVDFKAMAAETRRKMHAKFDGGQQLGSSRGGKAADKGKTNAPKREGRPKKG